MSFANPTPLKIGMTGTISDRLWRVAGRVVMGMDQDGETYYWNEFNLVDDAGESATLVFEQTEHGGQWRLFTLFEPDAPISAGDAATKRVGDPLNLDGTDVRVTLVDESRVYHIEGTAPEGVEVGDVARYFNAEAGSTMIVVSWSGEEVECYHGINVPSGSVRAAFGLAADPQPGTIAFDGAAAAPERYVRTPVLKIAIVLAVGLLICVAYAVWRPSHGPVVINAKKPSPALVPGLAGTLDGIACRVETHALVEVAEVGVRYQRHEYRLRNDDGSYALLVYGWKPGAPGWVLFTPLLPRPPINALQAAALRIGDTVKLDGTAIQLTSLFQATARRAESAEAPDRAAPEICYGFTAGPAPLPRLVRWNDRAIDFYRGHAVTTADVTSAFRR